MTMDHEQLRLAPELLDVMRGGVTHAIEAGAQFVAPAHLMLALLGDERVGPAIFDLVSHERVARAAEEAIAKLPEVGELPEGALPDGETTPFPRYDTLAFRSRDGARTLYLDRDAFRLFVHGARRAGDVYRPKHLAMGFVAASLKDGEIIALLGRDPDRIVSAVYEL